MESTFNWYWFVDGLRQQGRDVRLANPAKMEQYDGLKVGNDASDAGWIAEQLRLGILPESYVYSPEVRPIRDLLRRRMLIVRQRVQSLLSLESLFARHGWKWPGAQHIKSWTSDDLKGLQADAFTEVQAGQSHVARHARKGIRGIDALWIICRGLVAIPNGVWITTRWFDWQPAAALLGEQ